MGPISPIGPFGPICLTGRGAAARIRRRRGIAGNGVAGGIGFVGIAGIGLFDIEDAWIQSTLTQALVDRFVGLDLLEILPVLRGHRVVAREKLDRFSHLRIIGIEPEVARFLVAVAVVRQVDVDETLRREPRGLAFGVFAHLFAEDDASDAAILAGHFPVSTGHQPAEEELVLSRQGIEFLNGPFELRGGLLPAGPLGAHLGDSFEQLLLFGCSGYRIDGTGPGGLPFALPAVIVVAAYHGDCSRPGHENPTRSESAYINQTRGYGREFSENEILSKKFSRLENGRSRDRVPAPPMTRAPETSYCFLRGGKGIFTRGSSPGGSSSYQRPSSSLPLGPTL
jgi:hypothetical protein